MDRQMKHIRELMRLQNESTAELIMLYGKRLKREEGPRWDMMSPRLHNMIAHETCTNCLSEFYGTPDSYGGDYCPHCDTYQVLCSLCHIKPHCDQCPYMSNILLIREGETCADG